MAAETVVLLGVLVIVAQLFFVLLSLIGSDVRLRRIEKKLKVLVPDPPLARRSRRRRAWISESVARSNYRRDGRAIARHLHSH